MVMSVLTLAAFTASLVMLISRAPGGGLRFPMADMSTKRSTRPEH